VAKITPPDRREDNARRHRRAANPDNDGEHVQSSREDDLIHAHASSTERPHVSRGDRDCEWLFCERLRNDPSGDT
jgi:hypothetical protein